MEQSGLLKTDPQVEELEMKESASFQVDPAFQLEQDGTAMMKKKNETRVYGSTELRRVLNERHVNMIAFSSTIGIGLFLQSGKIIYLIGPGGALIAYALMGTLLWSAVASLGEMTALFPVKGPIIDFPSRYLDESVGFAVGWMAWFAYVNLTATEVVAVAHLFNFGFKKEYLERFNYPQESLGWKFGQETNPAVWVTIFLVVVLLVNLLPVRAYGEIEYVAGCIKMVVITGIIVSNVIINARSANGKGESHSTFRFYQKPYGFFSNQTQITTGGHEYRYTGDTGRLVGIWTAMNTIFFSLQGFFTVSVSAAENKNLDKDESIKLATRKISLRVILMYILVVFTVGLNVPYNDPNLADTSISSIRRGENSPMIIACVRNGVIGWPHFLNAFYIFSAFSTAINALYIASRLLHALASIRNVWPEYAWAHWIKIRLERTTSKGVPLTAVFVSWLVGFLAYLVVRPAPAKILGRMAVYCTCSMLIVYACVTAAFLSFKTRTIDDDPKDEAVVQTAEGTFLNRNASDYPYKSHLQWARAAYALVGCSLLLFFNGWRSFLHPFSASDFVASYLNVLIFAVLVAAYHVKDEREWNPLRWRRRVTMDIDNPTLTREKDKNLRKGRFHRANTERFWVRENFERILEFVWVWLK